MVHLALFDHGFVLLAQLFAGLANDDQARAGEAVRSPVKIILMAADRRR